MFFTSSCEKWKSCDTVAFDSYAVSIVSTVDTDEFLSSGEVSANVEKVFDRKLKKYVKDNCPECQEYYDLKKQNLTYYLYECLGINILSN